MGTCFGLKKCEATLLFIFMRFSINILWMYQFENSTLITYCIEKLEFKVYNYFAVYF